MERSDIWKTIRNAPKQAWLKAFRFTGLLFLFELLTLTAGIGVWMVFHGLRVGGSRLTIYWRPARSWLAAILKHREEAFLRTPAMTWSRWISLAINLSFSLFIIYIGIRILVQNGFLSQNLIYILYFKSR
jgi:uncharacterized transporter YbjL